MIGSAPTHSHCELSSNKGAKCLDKREQFPPRWTPFLSASVDLPSETRQFDVNHVSKCLCVKNVVIR